MVVRKRANVVAELDVMAADSGCDEDGECGGGG